MANRQTTFLLKRSNVPGKIPSSSGLTLGEMALNTADAILYTSGTTANSILPIGWDRIHRTGDTVTGNFVFNGNIDVTSISPVDYINFNTNPTVPSATGGTVYFDANENALSYKPITNQNDVTVNLGQESLIRIYNDLPTTILNGQVLHITGATIGVPTVALANASKLGTAFTESLAQSSGVATHDIPSGEYGFMTNFGIVRDLNTTAFTVGSEVFLSDTVDGALTNDPNNIAFTSRISTVGYCLESNATTGKILVVITNENPLQSLTQQEINVLLGNTISTGAYFYTGATAASTTTINVSPMRGWIVYNTGPAYATDPLVLNVYYSGGTNLPVSGLTTSFDTYLLVNSGGTLYQTNVFPSPQERRQNIFLGRVVHPNKTTILNVEQSVDYDVSPLSSLRDLWIPIKIINEGVVPSSNGANLTFKTSSGTFWANGIGFPTNELNPNAITVPGYLPASFYYTTQTGGTFTTTTTIVDTTKYDVGGVAVNIPGSGNYTTQRIYMSQSGVIRLQYGQEYYSTLAKAIAAIPSETFVVNPDNSIDCTLIGLLTVKDGTGDLSNIDDAVFTFVSKFGEILGGTGGISTTTLQQAYNNSVNPEITTDSVLGGVQFKGGTGSDTDKNIIIENNSGTETAYIRADGFISGNSLNAPNLTILGGTQSIFLGNSSSDLVRITQTGTGNAFVVEDDTNPDSSPFVIDASGNTGIGTLTPTTKLDVIGNTRVSGKTTTTNLQVTSNATPGYVLTAIDSNGNAKWEALGSDNNDLDPVLTIASTTASTVSVGDRFLISGATISIWSGRTNQIAEYTGSGPTDYSYLIPTTDDVVFVTDTLTTYRFNGTNWVAWRGVAILQNGNTLTTSVNIGTNNNQNLTFRTSGQTRVNIDTSGSTTLFGRTTLVQPQGSDYIVFSSSTLANSGQTMYIRQIASGTYVFGTNVLTTFMQVGPGNRINLNGQELTTNGSAVFGANRLGNTNMLNLNSIPGGFTSGTTDWRGVLVNPTVNFGGTYSGNFIGYLHNPTITSMANGRHIAMQIVSGDVLLNTTSGSVGIGLTGTTTPSAKLHINNTTSGNTFLAEDDTNPDSTPFVIDSSGNTGIGTLTPSAKLDIFASSALTNTIRIRESGNSFNNLTINSQGLTELRTNGGGSAIQFSVVHNGGTENFRVRENSIINFRSANSFDNSTQMGINVGNVLTNGLIINTLNIYDTPNTNRNLVGFTPSFSWAGGNNTGSTLNIAPTYNIIGGSTTALVRGIYYNPSLQSLSGTTHRAIETTTGDVIFGSTSGNVGIGTLTPTTKLVVSGNTIISSGLSASTVTITTQPTSGYTSTEILMRNSTTGQVEITDSTSPAIYNFGISYAMTNFNYLT